MENFLVSWPISGELIATSGERLAVLAPALHEGGDVIWTSDCNSSLNSYSGTSVGQLQFAPVRATQGLSNEPVAFRATPASTRLALVIEF